MFHNNSVEHTFLRYIGVMEDDKKKKLAVKQKKINKVERKELNYHQSPHVQQMQRSVYIKIDDDFIDKLYDQCCKEEKNADFKIMDPDVYKEMTNTGYEQKMRNQTSD